MSAQSPTNRAAGWLSLNHDVLLTILQYSLPCDEPVEIPPKPRSGRLVLGQVCRDLRWSLYTNPIFWTKFNIVNTDVRQYRELLWEWLHLSEGSSNSLPISIENKDESKFSLRHLEEFVFPQADRLFRLHIHLTYDAFDGFFTLLPSGIFPKLSDFSVLCTESWEPSVLTVEPLFVNSPLNRFSVVLGPIINVRGLGITWANVKDLQLAANGARFYFPISWIHAILNASRSSLETCSVALEPTTDPELPGIELPHLKTLSINFRDPGWKTQTGILNFLTLPSLESLDLSSRDGLVFNEACAPLRSFFLRSPNITHLRFERIPVLDAVAAGGMGITVDSQEHARLLTLLPNLRHVQLPKGRHTSIVLVLEPILSRRMCPLLESLKLAVHNGPQVVKMIQQFWRMEAAGAGERSLKVIRLIDPKLSWIEICEPSAAEDQEIAQAREIIQILQGEQLRIEI